MSNRAKSAYRTGITAIVTVLAVGALLYSLHSPDPSQVDKADKKTGTTTSVVSGQVTLVILPPHLKSEDPKTRTAAELLCDRLAEELSDQDGIKVVDRTQIERILRERKIETQPMKSMLAYDLMTRISVDTIRPMPQVRLELIDLSAGNVVAAEEFAWSVSTKNWRLSDMVELCRQAAGAVKAESDQRLKIRLLGVENPAKVVRLGPMGQRLRQTFYESMSRLSQVRLVHHLEAATSREESLLILMGLSKLPGGRQFAPQSDVTLRFRLAELDAVGKTFDQTTIRLGFCLERAGELGEWAFVEGKVADWDDLVKSAWKAMSKDLSEVQPQAMADFLNEMAVRRRQAETELTKVDWTKHAYSSGLTGVLPTDLAKPEYQPEYLKRFVQTAAASAKIDPTFEEAAFLYAKFNYMLQLRADNEKRPVNTRKALREVLQYLRRFKGNVKHRTEILGMVDGSMFWHLWRYNQAPSFWHLRPQSPDWPAASCNLWRKGMPEAAETVDLLRQIIDLSLSESISQHHKWEYIRLIWITYNGMLDTSVPEDRCKQWRQEAFEKAGARLLEEIKEKRLKYYSHRLHNYIELRAEAIRWALNENNPDKARALVEDFKNKIDPPGTYYSGAGSLLEAQLYRMEDRQFVKDFRDWFNGKRVVVKRRKTVKPLVIKWPKLPKGPVFQNPPAIKECIYRYRIEELKKDEIYYVRPIGIIGKRLYVYYAIRGYKAPLPRALKTGYIPLGEDGRTISVGKYPDCWEPVERKHGKIVALPQPKALNAGTKIYAAGVIDGKCYLGTEGAGILLFDPKKNKWTQIAGKQGLPHLTVYKIHQIDDHRLFCIGGEFRRETIVYTLDMKTGEVVLLQRIVAPGKKTFWLSNINPIHSICGVWRVGDKWKGMCRKGIVDDLLGRKPTVRSMPAVTPQGWKYSDLVYFHGLRGHSMATVKGRHFVASLDGLREIDSSGKTLRTWGSGFYFQFRPVLKTFYEANAVKIPHVPFPHIHHLAQDDSYLFVSFLRGVMCYDPNKDLWYGPVQVEDNDAYFVQTLTGGNGIWLDQTYLLTKDIINTARKAGLVYTTKQLTDRREKILLPAAPIDRAKFYFALHRFDKAGDILNRILQDDPENAKALLLMGRLHDVHCLNKPDAAIAYYKRLKKLPDAPDANVSGLFLLYCYYIRSDKPEKALEVGEEMIARFLSPPEKRPGPGPHIKVTNIYIRLIIRTNKRLRAKIKAANHTPTTQKIVKRTGGQTSK